MITFRQGYGMTEMSPAATIARIGTDKPSSIGALLPNMEMKIVDVETKVVGIRTSTRAQSQSS